MPHFISSQKCTPVIPRIIRFETLCKNLSMKEDINRFSNLKYLQIVIRDKWHDVDVRQSESEKP